MKLRNSLKQILTIGVGASAGGLEAFQEFLLAVGESSQLAMVFVQHLDPHRKSLLADLLRSSTHMEVVELSGRTKLKGGTVYLCPPQRLLEMKNGFVQVVETDGDAILRHVIDHFFHSLAVDQGERAVGVILSGTGSDGTLGLKAISDAGGLTFAQEPLSAKFDSMPRSAAATGVADHVLTPTEMAKELLQYSEHMTVYHTSQTLVGLQDEIAQAIPAISEVLMKVTNHNFQHYKISTLSRRIQRRMQVQKIATVDEYVGFLSRHEEETQALFRELLIGVTAFFRDPEAFESLASNVLPNLFQGRGPSDTVRIWVAGCANGAEAYTMAMLCREAIDNLQQIDTTNRADTTEESHPTTLVTAEVQIFATDIDEHSLQIARKGIFPIGIEDQLSPERLKRFFHKRGKRYQVIREIRDMILFSAHNLISDPPFSRLDLISCRNLLIYLGPHLQTKLIPVFHYALRPGGYLLLGPSENITSHAELFRPVDAKNRISQRKGTAIGSTALMSVRQGRMNLNMSEDNQPDSITDLTEMRQRIVLDEFAPKSCVIDETGQVLNAAPNMQKYLSIGEGDFQNNIIKMAASGLRIGLRAAIAEAKKTVRKVQHENLSVRIGDVIQRVMVTVQPMPRLGENKALFMVVFHDVGLPIDRDKVDEKATTTSSQVAASSQEADSIIAQLERELETMRTDLDNSLQDMDVANQELKSSNEELLSMNEELQSANEELETSKEEISASSEAVTRANSDLQNLLRSSRIATVFLDDELLIRSFTPAITEIYDLIITDIGRPLQRFVPHVKNMPPLPDAKSLVNHGCVEHTILADSGKSFIRRVLPYQSSTGEFEGIVVTFTDVTQLRESEDLFKLLVEASTQIVWMTNADGLVVEDSPSWRAFTGQTLEQWVGNGWLDAVHPEDRETTLTKWKSVISSNGNFSVEYRLLHHSGQYRWTHANGVALRNQDGSVKRWVGTNTDIDDQKRAEQALRESEARFRVMADGLPLLIWVHDHEGKQIAVNRAFCEFYNVDEGQMRNMEWQKLAHPDDFKAYTEEFVRCVQEHCPFHAELRVQRADGQWRWLESWGQPHFSDTHEYSGHIGASADITDRKRQAFQIQFIADLQASLDQLQNSVEIAAMAAEKVFDWIKPSRCNLIRLLPDNKSAEVFGEKTKEGQSSSLGSYLVSDFLGDAELEVLRSDRPLVINDIHAGSLSNEVIERFAVFGTRALLVIPYVSGGNLQFALSVDRGHYSDWEPHEVKLLSDVTERLYLRLQRAWAEEKTIELAHKLRESNDRLELATSAAKMGMFDWNIDTDANVWDEQHLDLTGLRDAPHSGQNFLSCIHPEDVSANNAAINQAIVQGAGYNTEFRFHRPDGQQRWLAARGRVIQGSDGFRHFIGLNWDITESKAMEKSLHLARELADAANASKSEFLANMSHEIRTPMTAILGYADLLCAHVQSEEARRHLNTIRRNGDYLLEIINDILDLSKIEADKLDIDIERFEPARVVEDVRSIMEVRAKESGLKLEVTYETKIPRTVQSDAKRLKQILINLVGNAIKFTREGEVKIAIQLEEDSIPARLRFSIIDTGIGMSIEQQQRLFKPFSQGDSIITQQFGGTGLGLAISQRLASMLGGEISVKSTLNQGSTFTFTMSVGNLQDIPLIQPDDSEEATQEVRVGKEIRLRTHILVVDDRRDIRFLSKHIITEAGGRVSESEDGLLAIETVKRAATDGTVFDLVLLDMQMPNMDGYETARQLRKIGYPGPIIALTADAMQGDMSRCIECGCNDYLSKPIDKNMLLQKVAKWIDNV